MGNMSDFQPRSVNGFHNIWHNSKYESRYYPQEKDWINPDMKACRTSSRCTWYWPCLTGLAMWISNDGGSLLDKGTRTRLGDLELHVAVDKTLVSASELFSGSGGGWKHSQTKRYKTLLYLYSKHVTFPCVTCIERLLLVPISLKWQMFTVKTLIKFQFRFWD